DVIETALNKTALYQVAERLGIAIPESWYLDGLPLETLAEGPHPEVAALAARVPYPVILKPDESRAFYEAFRAKVFVVQNEIEFVQDPESGRHLLLDVNTRSWKWIGLPVASGIDLPLLAYRDAVGAPFDAPPQRDGVRWTFLRDYVKLLRARANVMPEEMVT